MRIYSGLEMFCPSVDATVRFTVRQLSGRVSARWRNGKVYVNVPEGMAVEQVLPVLDNLSGKITESRPKLVYRAGQKLEFDRFCVAIVRNNRPSDRIMTQIHGHDVTVYVGAALDMSATEVTLAISDRLCAAARRMAAQVLLPRAHELALRVGVIPREWQISSGHRILGRCSSARVVALSYVNMFLPGHLRDYIVYHELAHLSEMNHSQRFHNLCDRYCDGNERKYINELRQYNWPIIRK